MRLAGFAKFRNEVIREGNLYRILSQLDQICDCGVICDDASTDGTREALETWVGARGNWSLYLVERGANDFRREMHVKQAMLDVLHASKVKPDWILWQDGDELFNDVDLAGFRSWLEQHKDEADVWAFHYTQPWRTLHWARTDDGFDQGWFWKLWRYSPDLHFELADQLHSYQFPKNFLPKIMEAVHRGGGSFGCARRAPQDILHVGNVGKNLIWKCIQYRNSGPLQDASMKRHLYFDTRASYRAVEPAGAAGTRIPQIANDLPRRMDPNVPFTEREQKMIEQMGDLKGREGLCVVIVPTYNRAALLPRTIASVVSQTYENWVCVVLDDGSTDDTAEVMRELQDSDPRIFYCRYETNRGGVAMNEIGMDLACLPGSTRVTTASFGLRRLDELKAGDRVFTWRDGTRRRTGAGPQYDTPAWSTNEQTVRALIDRGLKQTFTIKTQQREIRATADHRFLLLSRVETEVVACTKCGAVTSVGWGGGYRRCKACRRVWRPGSTRLEYKTSWVEAVQLQKGDLLVVGRGPFVEGAPAILPEIPIGKGEFRPKTLSATTPDFMRLVGYFLGDGCMSTRKPTGPSGVCWCEPPDSSLRPVYEQLVRDVFGTEHLGKAKASFIQSSSYAARLFAAVGLDKHAAEKNVPSWVFSTTLEERRAVLEGYTDADGHRSADGGVAYFKCASRQLLLDMKALAESLGLSSSRVRYRRTWTRLPGQTEIREFDHWESSVRFDQGVGRHTSSAFGSNGKIERVGVDGPFGLDRVVSVTPFGEERVFDIEVEGDHNFIADGFVVHNCEFGEFWVRLGSDDYFKRHKLEMDVKAFREMPSAGACWGPYRDLHGERDERELRGIPTGPNADARGSLLSHGFAASWANIAVRTSVLKQVRERHGRFCEPEIRNMEDYLVNARIAYFTEFAWRAQLKDGRVIVATILRDSWKHLVHLIGDLENNIVHDAVWHIGADGASQKGTQCGIDATATMKVLQTTMTQFTPAPREEALVKVVLP